MRELIKARLVAIAMLTAVAAGPAGASHKGTCHGAQCGGVSVPPNILFAHPDLEAGVILITGENLVLIDDLGIEEPVVSLRGEDPLLITDFDDVEGQWVEVMLLSSPEPGTHRLSLSHSGGTSVIGLAVSLAVSPGSILIETVVGPSIYFEPVETTPKGTSAVCPAGTTVTGGGWTGEVDRGLRIRSTQPVGTNQWQIVASNYTTLGLSVRAVAVCASILP